jgi:hypothetical protein
LTRVRAFVPLLALACGLMLLPGCGGGGGGDFKKEFAKQNSAIQALGPDLAKAIQEAPKKSEAANEAAFTALADRVKAINDALGKLKPASNVSGDFTSLKSGLTKVEGDVRDLVAAAKANDKAALVTAVRALLTDGAQVKSARQAIEAGAGK